MSRFLNQPTPLVPREHDIREPVGIHVLITRVTVFTSTFADIKPLPLAGIARKGTRGALNQYIPASGIQVPGAGNDVGPVHIDLGRPGFHVARVFGGHQVYTAPVAGFRDDRRRASASQGPGIALLLEITAS